MPIRGPSGFVHGPSSVPKHVARPSGKRVGIFLGDEKTLFAFLPTGRSGRLFLLTQPLHFACIKVIDAGFDLNLLFIGRFLERFASAGD